MIKNLALTSLIAMFFSLEFSYAGCGACNVTSKKADKPDGNFVTKIGEDGNIGGLVLASCGMCNFGMDNKDYFGNVFYTYSFGQAIKEGYLSDYRVAVVGVNKTICNDFLIISID